MTLDLNDIELAQIRELLDRQAIWDCLVRFSRGMDRLDVESGKSAYHDDSWDDHGQVVMSGAELSEFAVDRHRRLNRHTQHMLTNHKCEIDGDTAHTETYFLFVGSEPGDEPTDLRGGRYIDRLERRNGEWKILKRLAVIEWSTTVEAGPWSSDPRFSRSAEDASYMRPLEVRTTRKVHDAV